MKQKPKPSKEKSSPVEVAGWKNVNGIWVPPAVKDREFTVAGFKVEEKQ